MAPTRWPRAGEVEWIGTAAATDLRQLLAGVELWYQLGLDEFWRQRLPQDRERALGKKSVATALGESFFWTLAVSFTCTGSGSNRILLVWLKQKWADLFQTDFEAVLCDLASTYFEGETKRNPKARRLQPQQIPSIHYFTQT